MSIPSIVTPQEAQAWIDADYWGDALPQGTLIVSPAGRVQRRELVGGLSEASGTTVGTLKVWAEPGAHETGRKPHRSTSVELAAGGHVWTVVFRTAAAS